MEWVNYHHLLYFWVVAREGGLVPAGKVLSLSHPTLSAQIHALEAQLGEQLFAKQGRKLALTEVGRVVYRYADEIFSLGREMLDTVKGRSTGQVLRLDVGIANVVPKLIVRRLATPPRREGARRNAGQLRGDGFPRLGLRDQFVHQVLIGDVEPAIESAVSKVGQQGRQQPRNDCG